MKKSFVACMLLFLIYPQLYTSENETPTATITEIEGTIEIERMQGWEQLAPLLPLFAGDRIRVSKPGKAVVMYLGGSPIAITEAESPYTIKKLSLEKSKKEKVGQKLTELINKLLGKESRKSVDLVVRGDVDCSKTIQPNDSIILFPEEKIMFCWPGQQPPYSISIFKDDSKNGDECIYNKTTNDTFHFVPIEIFKENTSYSWALSSPLEEWDGSFTLKSQNDTGVILKEIINILNEIPEEFSLTRTIVEYQLLIDYKLFYDANKLICKSLSLFPDNETLKLMLSTL
jgi:hypothetical protein